MPTKAASNPMNALYSRLRLAGFPKKFVTSYILPEWWDDEAALHASGLSMARGYISRHLGLSLVSLRDPNSQLECAYELAGQHQPKFKLRTGVSEETAKWAACLAASVAEIALCATPETQTSLPRSASVVRTTILQEGVPHVGLSNLLDYCWDLGIPVLHIAKFPGNKHMDGMALAFEGRPAIILAKNSKFNAWLSFVIAHELGHIIKGHLSKSYFIYDAQIDGEPTTVEEREANAFALELLIGDADRSYCSDLSLTAPTLAVAAKCTGKRDNVDPGVIVLNYVRKNKAYALANAALKVLYPEADAITLIRNKMNERLDWERIPEESAEYLRRICGIKSVD